MTIYLYNPERPQLTKIQYTCETNSKFNDALAAIKVSSQGASTMSVILNVGCVAPIKQNTTIVSLLC